MFQNPKITRNNRKKAPMVLTNGEDPKTLTVAGDFFYVRSASGDFDVSINGDDWTPGDPGLLHGGVVGQNEVDEVKFRTTAGSPVTLLVIYGKGTMQITGQTSISNPTFGLDSSAVADLTGDGTTVTPVLKFLNNESHTAPAPRSFSVQNTGVVDITVTIGATAYTLPSGAPPFSFAVNALGLRYPNIQVNATGGTATFIYEL